MCNDSQEMSFIDERYYFARLAVTEGIGAVLAKKLVAYCGGAAAVYERNLKQLATIPGIGTQNIQHLFSQKAKEDAEQVMRDVERLGLRMIPYTDSDYPRRLVQCHDAPLLLFQKGRTDLNPAYALSVVGTRYATDYGKGFTDRFIEGLKDTGVVVVSGLAHGIDIQAHKAALRHGLPTIAVLAHGLDHIYPAVNRPTAKRMQEEGGSLLSEFVPGTPADKDRFPMRNRIIAGLSDATVVMESDKKGGSMITARMANDYARDVFALPGRVGDRYARGTNLLIRTDAAHLLESPKEFLKMMGWDERPKESASQASLFVELDQLERTLAEAMGTEPTPVDVIAARTDWPMSKVSAMLLSMEFKGLVRAMPGKRYTWTGGLVSA